MLEGKYLTKEGLEMLLNDCYEGGARYMYRPTGFALIYLSKENPIISDDCGIKDILEGSQALPVHIVNLLNDIFENTNCIDIGKALNKIDWSKVPVDAKVRAYIGSSMKLCHFAFYKEGRVYTWSDGGTSWSTPYTYGKWDRVELAEEI